MNETIKINNLPSNSELHGNYLLITQSDETNAETQKVSLSKLISFFKTQLDINEEEQPETDSNFDLNKILAGYGISIEKDIDNNTATISWEPKGWSAETKYLKGNVVIYNSAFYKCAEEHISSNDFEKKYWEFLGFKSTSKDYIIDIPAHKWIGDAPPYIQAINIYGLTEEDYPLMDLIVSSSMEEGRIQLQQWSSISKATTELNTLTLYCYFDKPTIDFKATVKVV